MSYFYPTEFVSLLWSFFPLNKSLRGAGNGSRSDFYILLRSNRHEFNQSPDL